MISANRSESPETTILREELARLVVENSELCETASRRKGAYSERVATLEAENDRLRLEIAGRNRSLAKYKNPHQPVFLH